MTRYIYRVVPTAAAACLLFLFIFFIPVVPCTAAGSDIVFGDINDDGQVNVADAVLLLRYIVGLTALEPDQVGRANVNASHDAAGNPTPDVGDAILILRRITGFWLTGSRPSQQLSSPISAWACRERRYSSILQSRRSPLPYSEGTMEQKTALFGLPYGASASAEGVPPR